MNNLNNCSKLIVRNKNLFVNKKILIFGLFDIYIYKYFNVNFLKMYTNNYNIFKKIKKHKIKIYLNSILKNEYIIRRDLIIYYWPKSNVEAKFQIENLLYLIPKYSKIFFVGRNRSSIKSVVKIFQKYIYLKKIDAAKNCILYLGIVIKTKKKFSMKNYFSNTLYNNLIIKNLPGVFSYKKIDSGTKLLLSTFYNKKANNKNYLNKTNVLDLGCGSGVIGINLKLLFGNIKIFSIDNNATSILITKKNFKINFLEGNVMISDLFSNIKKKFDLIVSNPSIHNNWKINDYMILQIIEKSNKYLKKKGELRIVTHNFKKYEKEIKKRFSQHTILLKKKHFVIHKIIK
ncbi:methyltransferase [Buchnera aphidicola (Taiwanaphis decaspermi)]|uniref:methyltransferase n=1 Tax=Buchnera aphidicola TaxID=9 RepID=UPI0031B86DD9